DGDVSTEFHASSGLGYLPSGTRQSYLRSPNPPKRARTSRVLPCRRMPKVRVVFDAREVTADARYSGIGTFVRELLPAMAECDGIEVVAVATPDLVLPPAGGRGALPRFTQDRRRATRTDVTRVRRHIARA